MQLDFTSGVALYYANASAAWNAKGDFKRALTINQEGLAYCLKINNKKAIAKSYGNIAASYQYLSMYDSATDYYLKSSSILEQLKDSNALATIYSNLTGLFCNLYRIDACINYGNKALAFHNKGFWPQGLSNTYANLGNGYVLKKNYIKAEDCFNKSISIAEQQKDIYTLSVVYGSMEQMLRNQKRYKQMLAASEKCLYYTRLINSKDLEANAYNVLANAHYYNKNFKAAIDAGLKGIEIANEQGIEDEVRKISALLAYSYAALHDLENSEKYAALHDSIQEHILNEKVFSNIEVMQAKLKQEKLQTLNAIQMQQLQQRRFWIILLLMAMLLVATAGVFYYVISKRNTAVLKTSNALQQQQIQSLEQQKKIEATDAIIKGQEKERARLAKDLHDGLGGMLSSVKYAFINFKESAALMPPAATLFQQGIVLLDESINELRRVAHNMMPEGLMRFGLDNALSDLCKLINANTTTAVHYQAFSMDYYEADSSTDLSLFRMAQELINNALKHSQAKQIIVQLHYKQSELVLLVEDDGVGFNSNKPHTGMGLQNLNHRVNFLKGHIEFESALNKGTTVTITIPAKQ
ncbi:MAG: sensor histidine kinase [Chitinophagales bacterium]